MLFHIANCASHLKVCITLESVSFATCFNVSMYVKCGFMPKCTSADALQVRPGTWPARAKSAPSHSEENPQRPSSMAAVKSFGSSADHMGSSLRQSDRFRKLRNQHMPGERLYQSTTFHSTVMMKHDAACSVQSGLQPLQRAGNAQGHDMQTYLPVLASML